MATFTRKPNLSNLLYLVCNSNEFAPREKNSSDFRVDRWLYKKTNRKISPLVRIANMLSCIYIPLNISCVWFRDFDKPIAVWSKNVYKVTCITMFILLWPGYIVDFKYYPLGLFFELEEVWSENTGNDTLIYVYIFSLSFFPELFWFRLRVNSSVWWNIRREKGENVFVVLKEGKYNYLKCSKCP